MQVAQTSPREASPDPRSESPADDLYEPAMTEQMFVDDEITFNLTKHAEDMEEEEKMEEGRRKESPPYANKVGVEEILGW